MKIYFWVLSLIILFFQCECPNISNKNKINKTEDKFLKICIIDVDQGDAILIMTPDNKYILIDGGKKTYGNNEINPLLDSLQITHLDYIFASHFDADHIGGLDEVINHSTRESIINYCYDRGDTFLSQQFWDYKTSIGNKRKTIAVAETLIFGEVKIICVCVNGKLINGDSVKVKDENDFCIGLVIKYRDFEFFTAGDISGVDIGNHKNVETKLAPLIGDIDVYKVSHHGSKYSSNSAFLNIIKPEAAIISVGTNNYGHPAQEVLNRLINIKSRIYQTNSSDYGNIAKEQGCILNGDIWIKVFNDFYLVDKDTFLFR
ncbi:MAG: MBL fold metallo-hydrolase [candidate division WOR-3 bacterium]